MRWRTVACRAVEHLSLSRWRAALMVGTFAAGVALSVGAAQTVAHLDVERERSMVEREAAIISSRVVRHNAQTADALRAVRPLWQVHRDPTREQFEAFFDGGVARRVDDGAITYAGLPTISFIRVVRAGEATDFLAQRRAERPSAYQAELENGTTHYVVDYHSSRELLGFDLYPFEGRRNALERARDTGRPTATPWFDYIADLDQPIGQRRQVSALYLPVYVGGRTPTTLEARREQIAGWLAAGTLAEPLLEDATEDLGAGVALYEPANTTRRLIAHHGDAWSEGPRQRTVVDVDGRSWIFDVVLTSAPPASLLVAPSTVLIIGILTTCMVVALLWMLGRLHAQAEQRATTATARMHVSDRSLRLMAEHVPVGIVELDASGELQWMNSRALDMVGLESSEAVTFSDWADLIPDEDIEEIRRTYARCMADKEPLQVQHRLRTADGARRWIEQKGIPVTDERGELQRLVVSVNDISTHVELQHALRRARDAALEASRLKSVFLANMSHEIRTPLNGVLGMANLLLDGQLTAEQRSRVITLRTAAHQLLGLLNDILDLSKIEAGRLHLEAINFDLPDVVHQVLRLHTSAAFDRGLTFTSDIADDVPAIVVGDPMRIRQVLDNLLGNAVKFTDVGGVHLRVTTRRLDVARAAVRFEVRDTGIGISRDAQRRIFRPFTQADTSTTRQFGGTGLGLTICAQLAELMGGELSVDSVEGQGSAFRLDVELPVERWDRPAQPFTESDHAEALVSYAGGEQETAPDLRLLLVEDNVINQQVALGLLGKMGFTVDVANDGVEAVEAVETAADRPYDAILMDCQMPRMDGYEATRRIRQKEPEGRHIPIIALTAAAMKGDRERCLAAGMDDYVPKPVSTSTIAAALRRCLAADVPDPTPVRPAVTASEPAQTPVLDWQAVHELTSVEHLFQRSSERFLASVPSELAEMRAAIGRSDLDTARALAHKLKGAASTIGVARLAAALVRLELACDDAPSTLDNLMDRVDDRFVEARQALLAAVADASVTESPRVG